MGDGIEVPWGSHDEALDRFAELWWDDGRTTPDAAPRSREAAGPVVIRAERA